MRVDDNIEKVIGAFGKYQTWTLILITLGRLPAEFQLTNVVFILPSADFVCMDDDAYNVTNHCPCMNPMYDESTIVNSVTSEWNLICGRTSLASLAQSMLQVGILAGSLLYGYISDRYGRKLAVLLSLFFTAAFGVLSGVVPHLWMFMASRFLIGTSVGGTMLCCYILLIELSGKSFHPYLIVLIEGAYISGYFLMGIIAYFVREWRYLQLITSVPWLLVVGLYWIIPESPRWLITVGRKQKAVTLLTYIAKKNNRCTNNIEAIVYKMQAIESEPTYGSYLDLFRTPKIRFYSIISAFVWMSCAHTFFGINQYIGRLQGNIYLNVILSSLCLIPAMVFVLFATLYLKRRLSVILGFLVAAISLLLFLVIPTDIQSAMLAFSMIGQSGIYAVFTLIYLYSSDIFPTVIRNSAIGLSSVFARFGSFIAPFVVNISTDWISILIFSALSFGGAILCFFLPETKDRVLLNTIDETERPEVKIREVDIEN